MHKKQARSESKKQKKHQAGIELAPRKSRRVDLTYMARIWRDDGVFISM
jgi:hypothetical protein